MVTNFYEKISDSTMEELNSFLEQHPEDLVDYMVWREALELIVKVRQELIDSVKEYKDRFDEIIKEFKEYEKNSKLDFLTFIKMDEVNQRIANLQVMPNQNVEEKLQKLQRKRYY